MYSMQWHLFSGNAPIPIGETTVDVTINGIACGVTYTIIAGGTFDGDLVGPRSSHGTDTAGPCPPSITPTTVPTSSMTGKEDIILCNINYAWPKDCEGYICTYIHMYSHIADSLVSRLSTYNGLG